MSNCTALVLYQDPSARAMEPTNNTPMEDVEDGQYNEAPAIKIPRSKCPTKDCTNYLYTKKQEEEFKKCSTCRSRERAAHGRAKKKRLMDEVLGSIGRDRKNGALIRKAHSLAKLTERTYVEIYSRQQKERKIFENIHGIQELVDRLHPVLEAQQIEINEQLKDIVLDEPSTGA